MKKFCIAVAKLQATGTFVVSPLLMHYVAESAELPNDWEYWKQYSKELLSRCDEFYILCLDGWEQSTGVKEETEIAKALGKPVHYLPANFVE